MLIQVVKADDNYYLEPSSSAPATSDSLQSAFGNLLEGCRSRRGAPGADAQGRGGLPTSPTSSVALVVRARLRHRRSYRRWSLRCTTSLRTHPRISTTWSASDSSRGGRRAATLSKDSAACPTRSWQRTAHLTRAPWQVKVCKLADVRQPSRRQASQVGTARDEPSAQPPVSRRSPERIFLRKRSWPTSRSERLRRAVPRRLVTIGRPRVRGGGGLLCCPVARGPLASAGFVLALA